MELKFAQRRLTATLPGKDFSVQDIFTAMMDGRSEVNEYALVNPRTHTLLTKLPNLKYVCFVDGASVDPFNMPEIRPYVVWNTTPKNTIIRGGIYGVFDRIRSLNGATVYGCCEIWFEVIDKGRKAPVMVVVHVENATDYEFKMTGYNRTVQCFSAFADTWITEALLVKNLKDGVAMVNRFKSFDFEFCAFEHVKFKVKSTPEQRIRVASKYVDRVIAVLSNTQSPETVLSTNLWFTQTGTGDNISYELSVKDVYDALTKPFETLGVPVGKNMYDLLTMALLGLHDLKVDEEPRDAHVVGFVNSYLDGYEYTSTYTMLRSFLLEGETVPEEGVTTEVVRRYLKHALLPKVHKAVAARIDKDTQDIKIAQEALMRNSQAASERAEKAEQFTNNADRLFTYKVN